MKREVHARQSLIDDLSERYSLKGIARRRDRKILQGAGWLLSVHFVSLAKRLLDIIAALALIVICAPLFAGLLLFSLREQSKFIRSPRLGRWGVPFLLYGFRFAIDRRHRFLERLPELFNLMKGDISLVGPRTVAPDEKTYQHLAWRRYDVRPGLLCLWWLRRRANIDYATEAEVDSEYIERQSFRGDLGIALRALPAALYGRSELTSAPAQIHLAGIRIDNLTMDEAVDYVVRACDGTGHPSQVCFVNADCVNIATKRTDYTRLLNSADLVLGDGIGIKVAGKILNVNVRQNVNGTDLFPRLCAALERERLGLFLLGGRPGVPEEVASWVQRMYPDIVLSGAHHGYFDPSEEDAVVEMIRRSGAAVLLVAFGVPKQEFWIEKIKNAANIRAAMGVGGLFDFYSGRIPRAPLWMRELALEWVFRFLQEPRRMWRRYFVGNVIFLWRVFQYRKKSTQQ